MVKKDKGYIMNIASSAGFLAGPGLNTYYATKNYVTKWTLGIYQELKLKSLLRSNFKEYNQIFNTSPVKCNFSDISAN